MELSSSKEDVLVSQPNLSAYTDYRQYLKDFYQFKKSTQSSPIRSYSYATFSAAADIKSPNYLKLIIDGQRNLSDSMIKKFAKALQLSKTEIEEFAALFHYGQAKDP
ncbi:MAG: TIGR02147 family protein, partial [Bdellovibrionales bacterium]|nr:TIGR02147 family protein [Bdellovibrionales bacterium]